MVNVFLGYLFDVYFTIPVLFPLHEQPSLEPQKHRVVDATIYDTASHRYPKLWLQSCAMIASLFHLPIDLFSFLWEEIWEGSTDTTGNYYPI